MKKSEREALLNALNIPEPQKKDAFISEFNEKKKNATAAPKIKMSRVFRYSSIAAVAALAIGIAGHFALNRNFIDDFNNDELTAPVVTTTSDEKTAETTAAVTETTEKSTKTTAAEKTESTKKSEKTSSSKSEQSNKSTTKSDSKTTPTTEKNQHKETTTASKVTTTKTVTTTHTPEENSPNTTTTSTSQPTGEHVVDGAVPNFSNDYTVNSDYYFAPPTEHTKIINLSQLKTAHQDGFTVPEMTFDELYEESDYVFSASVDEILNTHIGGSNIYAQHNVTITSCYKGDYGYGDKVSIFFRGGYMPAWMYALDNHIDIEYTYDDYIYDDEEVYEKLDVGEDYIFFVKKPEPYLYKAPDGALFPTFYQQYCVFTDTYPESHSIVRTWWTFRTYELEHKKAQQ